MEHGDDGMKKEIDAGPAVWWNFFNMSDIHKKEKIIFTRRYDWQKHINIELWQL